MGKPVTMGAMLKCSFGMAPSVLSVLPDPSRPLVEGRPAATIFDNLPMVNIMPFGMCQSLANPAVASATAAALGVLTPMPCVPVVAAPWAPGSVMVTIGSKPALTDSSMVMCNWAGVIDITNPGAITTDLT